MLRYSIELHPEVWRGPEARGRVCRLVQYPLARDLVPGVGPALPTREQRLRPRVADHPLQLGPEAIIFYVSLKTLNRLNNSILNISTC